MLRFIRPAALLAAAALFAACEDGAVEPEATLFIDAEHEIAVDRDIVYATGEVRQPAPGDKHLLLDVYRPATAGVPAVRPGVVVMHGGGFSTGSKLSGSAVELGRRFAELGYVAVSINYRLMGDDPPTEALARDPSNPQSVAAAAARVDATQAVAWLRANAADYGVDAGRIAVAGYSAGGVTALGIAYWEPGVQRSDVRGVFSLSGGLYGTENHVDGGEPPAILIHGELDHAREQHEAFADRADDVGLAYEMHVIPGVGHDTPPALDASVGSTTAWRAVVRFFYDRWDLAALP